MIYSPQQELYDQLYIMSQNLGFDTYDHLPMENENANYPFVVIGSNQLLPVNFKTVVGGQLSQNIDFWGDEQMRLTVTSMMNQLTTACYRELVTKHFRFQNRVAQTDSQIIQDTSVPNTVLNHGILTLVFSLK